LGEVHGQKLVAPFKRILQRSCRPSRPGDMTASPPGNVPPVVLRRVFPPVAWEVQEADRPSAAFDGAHPGRRGQPAGFALPPAEGHPTCALGAAGQRFLLCSLKDVDHVPTRNHRPRARGSSRKPGNPRPTCSKWASRFSALCMPSSRMTTEAGEIGERMRRLVAIAQAQAPSAAEPLRGHVLDVQQAAAGGLEDPFREPSRGREGHTAAIRAYG